MTKKKVATRNTESKFETQSNSSFELDFDSNSVKIVKKGKLGTRTQLVLKNLHSTQKFVSLLELA